MPDQPRKPLAALHPEVPEDAREFVRCRLDTIDIAPQTLDLPGLPAITLSFEGGSGGTITVRIDGPGTFFDASIEVSIEDGHLVADTSNLSIGRELVDEWIRDFNADLDAPPAKQLSSVSIKNGILSATKHPVAASTETTHTALVEPPMTPQEPPHHAGHPIPEPVAVDSSDPAASGPPPASPPAHVLDPIPQLDDSPQPESSEAAEDTTATQREHTDPSEIAGQHTRDAGIGAGLVLEGLDYDMEDLAQILAGENVTDATEDDVARDTRFEQFTQEQDALQAERDELELERERRRRMIPDEPIESVMPELASQAGLPVKSEGAPTPAGRFGWSLPVGVGAIAAAGVIIVAVVIGGFLWFGGGSGGDEVTVDAVGGVAEEPPTPTVDAPAGAPVATTGQPSVATTSGSSDSSPVLVPTPTEGPSACEIAAEQPSTMTFSSPDVGPTMSVLYAMNRAYDLGFPTPGFEWSGVPEATTQLLITAQKLTSKDAEGILGGTTDLLADGWPVGDVRWAATIPSDFTSVPRTWFTSGDEPDPEKVQKHVDAAAESLAEGEEKTTFDDVAMSLPEGVVEREHAASTVQIDGEGVRNKFIGPANDGNVFLFTIFALCDPPDPREGDPRAYRPDWARPYAIDQAWFVATATLKTGPR
jgi:hypothetical protein